MVIHTFNSIDIVNKAEIDDFLELSCFFDDPVDVGNLISGSSAFSKSSLMERVWRKGNPLTLLVGMETSTATMENSVEIP